MASFSDDESFAVDQILDQRKRKGIVEYLVQWKGESNKDPAASTWEPAESIAADCAKAVKSFLKSKSKKRSLSKSRKSSRSRSRSVSRGRKAADKVTPTRRSTRSSSRGRATKIPVSEKKATQLKASEEPTEKVQQVEETKKAEASSSTVVSSVSTTIIKESNSMSEEKKTEVQSEEPGRVLRSSTMAAREKLEVQRVHNEQRPLHKDDDKPRSAIWKVADYVVIVLFALSVVAALFLFLEKFIDLENFKKQAFPNVDILRSRLTDAVYSVLELLQGGVNKVSGLWLNLVDQIGGGSGKK